MTRSMLMEPMTAIVDFEAIVERGGWEAELLSSWGRGRRNWQKFCDRRD